MKIEFKKVSEVNLKGIYPVIQENEYKLLQGSTLIISDAEYNKIQKVGHYDIGPYAISKDLIRIATGEGLDQDQIDVTEKVGEKFIYHEDVVDVLMKGLSLETNVLMYGKGGHGKSEMAIAIFDELKAKGLTKEEPFVMTCGDGLTEEALFGGIDIKEFKDTGKLKYLFANSFLDHEVVIFEEIFDAPPQVLLALKDVMTSGWARKGNQVYKCKTKLFIGLTNRSKEDFAEDDSLEALMQRFALTLKVEWDQYERNDWRKLFDKVFGKQYIIDNKFKVGELVDILTENHKAKTSFVSPRTAVSACKLYCAGGKLDFISDIDKTVLAEYYKANKDRIQEEKDSSMFDRIEKYIEENKLKDIDTEAKLIALVLQEKFERTGEETEVKFDQSSVQENIAKLTYLNALIDIQSWSKVNLDKARRKKEEILSYIEDLKQ